jgi:hypothetical protein
MKAAPARYGEGHEPRVPRAAVAIGGRDVLAAVSAATLLLATGVDAAPAVFWASDPLRPGETALLIGDSLGTNATVQVERLEDTTPSQISRVLPSLTAEARAVTCSQASDQSVKFQVPTDLQPGVFIYAVSHGSGSAAGLLNRPQVWWSQGDLGTNASPGGWIRIFGKNLGWPSQLAGGITRVRLEGSSTIDLLAAGDEFAARTEVPGDTPPGTYRVYVHNGAGGNYAWSEPVEISIAQPVSWPQWRFDVTAFGAQGDGLSDDTLPIRAALAQAGAAGGGTVFFPRGRYALSGPLTIPRGTVLRGEKQEWVCLAWTDFTNPPPALIQGSNSFGLEELTLYADTLQNFIVGELGHRPQSGNVFLRSVRVRANTYQGQLSPVDVDQRFKVSLQDARYLVKVGGLNVVITNCDLYGSCRAFYLSRARGSRIAGNKFYNGRGGWCHISGSDGVIFEHNSLQGADLQSSGGSLNVLDGSGCSQNVYFASNQLSLLHGWDREAMTTDGGGGAYFGKIRSANGSVVELTGPPTAGVNDLRGAGVFILAGRGAGQFRRLAAVSGNWVTLDAPWTRDPDTNSDLTITMLQQRYLILGNDFTDTGAAQFFGTAIDSIMASNRGKRMRGFWGIGLYYLGYQPNWFCQFLDNRITEGNYYHWTSSEDSVIGVTSSIHAGYSGTLNWGTVIRRNQLDNNSCIVVYGSSRDVLVESNLVQNAKNGIIVSSDPRGVLVRGNKFVNVNVPILEKEYLRQACEDSLGIYTTQTPLAAWDFESLAGDRFEDVTGNGFPAMAAGGVAQSYRAGSTKAALFNGAAYLVIDQSPVIFNMPDLTVSFWLKPQSLRGRRGLVVKRFSSVPAPFVILQYNASICFEASDESGMSTFRLQTHPILTTNTWVNIVVTAQQGVGAAIYVNGVRIADITNQTNRFVNNEPLIIGRDTWGGDPPTSGTPGFYLGFMDDIKIWPRALSSKDVREMYNTPPEPPEGLRLY